MRKILFSGVQPSGNIHIGNYLGAIKQFVELQNNYEAVFCIVDEHAITIPQDPSLLRKKTLEVAAIYIAVGIDPQKSTIFIQSHVPAHAELGWILNTITPLGELERMTQYKEKSQNKKAKAGVFAGLLNYPTLMAADILLYKSEFVPVGEDQLQHVEFTRMLADKFNKRFGETFPIPKALINKNTARIMGLDNPQKKMSKSAENPNNYIALLDSPDEIRKKIKSAVTDSGSEIKFDLDKKPAISNLLAIYAGFSNKSIKDAEKMYVGKNYAEFKKDLAEIIIEGLKPMQEKIKILYQDEKGLMEIVRNGAKKASKIADKTLYEVKEKIGFLI